MDRGDDHGTSGRRRSLGPRQEDPAVGHCPKRDRCGDPCTTGGADTGFGSLGLRYQRCEPGETRIAGEDPAPTAATSTTAPPGVHVATAYLKPNQIQDLADQIGEIGTTAVGHDLKVQVRIELGGKTPVPKDLITKINGLLHDVSRELKFEN